MKNLILYIHGKGGNAGEGEYYKKFFLDADIYKQILHGTQNQNSLKR